MALRWMVLSFLVGTLAAQSYRPTNERPPALAQEFRGAWVATVYNIDWPSKPGLSSTAQQAQARSILDRLASLNMNAVMLQVRPQCDAFYPSQIEPWSHWLTGTMGRSPGYDPLAFWIREAHARGIEVHAWFNPYRALTNTSHAVSRQHVTQSQPHITKPFGEMKWLNPAHPETEAYSLRVIMDVLRRYDIDGVHLDDYFYPYPKDGLSFPDGKSPSQRRSYVDRFVAALYKSVKKEKPWVRVGISPFGIWRPGVPEGIEAGLDSYEHLAGDSRKWLRKGWVDYLAPQLYWQIKPEKQSFPRLLEWWRQQGERPVWPGIATARIRSSEDPTRRSTEIFNQVQLTRKIGRNWHGHIHWSAKSLMENRDGIVQRLAGCYTQPAAVPPMTWLKRQKPESPGVGAMVKSGKTSLRWQVDSATQRVAIQARNGRSWRTLRIAPASQGNLEIPRADAIAVTALDRFGNASPPKVLALP